MHCSVIEHGYDVIEFSNCSTEERGVSRVLTLYNVCSVHWRMFSTLGSVQYIGGYHEYIGGIS